MDSENGNTKALEIIEPSSQEKNVHSRSLEFSRAAIKYVLSNPLAGVFEHPDNVESSLKRDSLGEFVRRIRAMPTEVRRDFEAQLVSGFAVHLEKLQQHADNALLNAQSSAYRD